MNFSPPAVNIRMKMIFLGVDTSSSRGSVALLRENVLVGELVSESAESFSRSLLEMVRNILDENSLTLDDLDGIGLAVGPGSFTGIRIGLATAHGIAISKDLPLYGISTLEAMARCADENGRLLQPMLDAGRGDVYFARFRYDGKRLVRLSEDTAEKAENLPPADNPADTLCFGEGADKYVESIGPEKCLYIQDVLKHSTAAGAAMSAYEMKLEKKAVPVVVKPNYIRRGPV